MGDREEAVAGAERGRKVCDQRVAVRLCRVGFAASRDRAGRRLAGPSASVWARWREFPSLEQRGALGMSLAAAPGGIGSWHGDIPNAQLSGGRGSAGEKSLDLSSGSGEETQAAVGSLPLGALVGLSSPCPPRGTGSFTLSSPHPCWLSLPLPSLTPGPCASSMTLLGHLTHVCKSVPSPCPC